MEKEKEKPAPPYHIKQIPTATPRIGRVFCVWTDHFTQKAK